MERRLHLRVEEHVDQGVPANATGTALMYRRDAGVGLVTAVGASAPHDVTVAAFYIESEYLRQRASHDCCSLYLP
jgi:hypothetical protein